MIRDFGVPWKIPQYDLMINENNTIWDIIKKIPVNGLTGNWLFIVKLLIVVPKTLKW